MRKPSVILLCLLLSAPLIANAQEKVDLQMIGRIKAEGLTNSQVMETVSFLTDVHGPRLTGSPNMKAAGEWARDKMKEWGLVNAQLESWGVFGRGWATEKFSVEMIEPQYSSLIAYPEAWTGSTEGTITGAPVYAKIESEADFEKYRGKLSGAIVLTRPPVEAKIHTEADGERYDEKKLADLAMAETPGARSEWAARREEFRRQRELRDKAAKFFKAEGAAVLLSPSRIGDYGTIFVSGSGPRNIGAPPGLPSLILAIEHYNRIVRIIEKGIPVKLAINVQNKFYEADSLGYNTVAEIPGVDKKLKDEVVMLGGHLDSWHSGTGATDNAAGCAVAMEAVRILKVLGVQPRRTIRLALWSGEEQGLLGSRGYVKKHFGDVRTMTLAPEHEKFSAYFNLDNGTGKIRGVYLQSNEAVRPIFEAWLKPFNDLGANTLTIRNTSGTDHLSFNEIGLPGFQFIQDKIEYDTRTHHSNMDVYDHLQAGDLMQASVIMASFVYNAAMRDGKLPRKELPKPEMQRTTMQ
jgi:hypothetical protein